MGQEAENTGKRKVSEWRLEEQQPGVPRSVEYHLAAQGELNVQKTGGQRSKKMKSPCASMPIFRSPLSRMMLSPRLPLSPMAHLSPRVHLSPMAHLSPRVHLSSRVHLSPRVHMSPRANLRALEEIDLNVSLCTGSQTTSGIDLNVEPEGVDLDLMISKRSSSQRLFMSFNDFQEDLFTLARM